MPLASVQSFVYSQAVSTINGLGLNRMTALASLAISPFAASLYCRYVPPSDDTKNPLNGRLVLFCGLAGTVGALDLIPYSRVVTAVAGSAFSMILFYLRLDSK